ncbi:MAG: hypothetical protein CMF12_01715 [Idiomarina sp.]|nr:hypothetical protein [Idiomarina sp.]PHQ77121.1 MAG: hypothetical protein COB75_04935 [Idiomarina sp.]
MIVDSELLKAYKNTNYTILARPELCVRIGEAELALREIYPGYSSFCIVTAYNPKSKKTPEADNRRASQRLLQRLKSMSDAHLCAKTVAEDPQQKWPDERGFLVANLSKQDALALGQEFSQHAIVWLQEPRFRAEILICDEV